MQSHADGVILNSLGVILLAVSDKALKLAVRRMPGKGIVGFDPVQPACKREPVSALWYLRHVG